MIQLTCVTTPACAGGGSTRAEGEPTETTATRCSTAKTGVDQTVAPSQGQGCGVRRGDVGLGVSGVAGAAPHRQHYKIRGAGGAGGISSHSGYPIGE